MSLGSAIGSQGIVRMLRQCMDKELKMPQGFYVLKKMILPMVCFVVCNLAIAQSQPLELPFDAHPDQVLWRLLKGKTDDAQMQIHIADGKKYLTLGKKTAGVLNYISTPRYDVSAYAGQKWLLRFTYKISNYTHIATKPWHGANSQVMIYNQGGKRSITGGLTFTANTKNWQQAQAMVQIPVDAKTLELKFSFLKSTGIFSVKNISLTQDQIQITQSHHSQFEHTLLVPHIKAGKFAQSTQGKVHVQAAFDSNHLFLNVSAPDAMDVQPYKKDLIWKADSLQIALDTGFDRTGQRDNNDYEIGFARTDAGYYVHPFHIPPETVFPSETINWIFSRDMNIGTYKVTLPWKSMPVFDYAKSSSLGLSVLVNNLDDKGRQTLGWNDGISKEKNPTRFGTIILDKNNRGCGAEAMLDSPQRAFYAGKTIAGTVVVPKTHGDITFVKVNIKLASDNRVMIQSNEKMFVSKGENTLHFTLSSADLAMSSNVLKVYVTGHPGNIPLASRSWELIRYDSQQIQEQTLEILSSLEQSKVILNDKLDAFATSDEKPRSALVALGVVKQFLPYIKGDLKNQHYPRALYEAQQTQLLVDQAIQSLNEKTVRMMRLPKAYPLVIQAGGFANANGEPMFLSGGWALSGFPAEQIKINTLLGMNCAEPFAGYPFQMFPTEASFSNAREKYVEKRFMRYKNTLYPNDISQVIQLNPHAPSWAKEKYPEMFIPGNHTFFADPDHPFFQKLWEGYVAGTVQDLLAVYSNEELQNVISIEILNEPTFSSISQYTLPRFRKYIQGQYKQISQLNAVWQTQYESFDAVGHSPTLTSMLSNRAVFYDWCLFNNKRFADFYRDTIKIIHANAPGVPFRFMSKFSNGHLWTNRYDYNTGHDREQLSNLLDINACDTRVIPQPVGRYGLSHWVTYCMSFDLLKSLSPEKPLFDTELHNIQTVRFTRPDIPHHYTGGTLWLGAMHGLNGALIWDMWTGNRLKTQYAGKPFHYKFGQFLTQPRSMFEFFNESANLTYLQEQVLAFQNADRPIRFLYSLDSATMDGQSYLQTIKAAYEGFYFSGFKLGFVTPSMIRSGKFFRGLKLLVIPNARYIKAPELLKIQQLEKQGVKILMIGKQSLTLSPRSSQVFKKQFANAINWEAKSADAYQHQVQTVIKQVGMKQAFKVVETPMQTLPVVRSEFCTVNGKQLVWLMNLGNEEKTIQIRNAQRKVVAFNVLHQSTGHASDDQLVLPAYGVAMVEILEDSILNAVAK